MAQQNDFILTGHSNASQIFKQLAEEKAKEDALQALLEEDSLLENYVVNPDTFETEEGWNNPALQALHREQQKASFEKMKLWADSYEPTTEENSEYFDVSEFVKEDVEKPSGRVPLGFSPLLNSTFLDASFDFIKGIIQTYTGMNSGEVMRSQQTIDELNFMEKALDVENQFKTIDNQLEQAYLNQDYDAIKKLYPHRATLFDSYQEILPDLNRAKRKYHDEVMKFDNKQKAIDDYRNELLLDNETNVEDFERWNNVQNIINQNIHEISNEWEEGKEGNLGLLYQLPNAMGTSFSSLITSVGTGAIAAGANMMANSAALTAGPMGLAVIGGATLLGGTASIYGTLWSRNQESLSEVSNNYTLAVQQYAEKHNIDTSEIIAEGRRKLQELTGSYSDDPNSPDYRDDSQVITGMLTYGIEFGDLELDRAAKISRRRLEDVYDRNMSLVVSDVAQNVIMLPAVGKFLNKAASTGVDDVLAKQATKTIDDIIAYTGTKVARASAESAAKRSSKYIVDPLIRVGYTGLSEGFEELSQYMFGMQMDPDAQNINESEGYKFYNPLDFLKMQAENAGMLMKGIAGLMGISDDPALNNDEELATNFKVGALVGMLMGGGSQFNRAQQEFNSYNKGWEIGRSLVKDHVNAREAMYRYTQYAQKALGGAIDWDTFSEGFDTAINATELPPTWTKQELEAERKKAKNIFAMAEQSDILEKIPENLRPFALAYTQYQQDRFDETKKVTVDQNTEFFKNLSDAAKKYCELHGIDEIHAPLIAEYFRLKEGKEALKKYEDSWMFLKGQKEYSVDSKKADNKLIEFGETRKDLEDQFYLIEQQLKDSGLFDLVKKHNQLTEVTDQIASNTISNTLQTMAIKDIQADVRRVLNDPVALKEAAAKYEQSIKDNEQITERARQVEDENEQAAIDEQEEQLEEYISQEEGTGVSVEVVQEEPVIGPVETELTEEDAIPVETEEPSVGGQINDLLAQAEQSALEESPNEQVDDYDRTDQDEELSEETLNNDPFAVALDFEETILDEAKRTKEEVNQLRDENTQLKDKISALEERLAKLEELVNSLKQGQPHELTEHPEQASEPIDEGDAHSDETLLDDEQVEVDEFEGDTPLFFNPTATTPMLPGYGTGSELNTHLSTPGAAQASTYNAWIGDKDSAYGKYDPNDRSTWDNAAVYVEIVAPDGKKYITALKTIEGAKMHALSQGRVFSAQQENELRSIRNTIIAAKLADPDAEVTFEEIHLSSGKLNNKRDNEGRAVQRKLTEIKGLHLPTDLRELLTGSHGIRFGIGKGVRGKSIITDLDGNVLPGQGGSGAIYIYPAQSSTLSGVSRPIQLTSKRFVHTAGDTNSFAYQISKALIFAQQRIEDIKVSDLLALMLNYGKGTLLRDSEKDALRHLVDKQFDVDYTTGKVTLGGEIFNIEDLRNDDGIEKMAQFIANNLHWNTDKSVMKNKLPDSFKLYLVRKGLKKASLFNGELEFEESDAELSGLAFLVKHGYLTSDLDDLIYTSPFVYVAKPIVKTKIIETAPDTDPTGADNPALDLLLKADNAPDAVETSDPYTDPNSDEVTAFFGDLDGAPKTVPANQVGRATRKINEKQARKWLADKLGIAEEDVEVVDGVIRTLSNGKAVLGVAKADSILLSSKAEHGVQYHEAWHRVSLLMLSPEQKQRLYREFKKANPRYRNASNKVVEEAIADQFMDYMVANDKEGIKYYITKWFRKFKHFIGINANIDQYSLPEMFKAIKYGELAKYKLNEDALKLFAKSYKEGANYTIGPNKDVNLASINSPYEYQQLLNSLKSIVVVSNGLKYISQILNIDKEKTKQFIIKRAQSPRLSTSQREVLNEVIQNFDTIMLDLNPIIERMGIREIDETRDADFNSRETTGTPQYDKTAYEFNKKENALGSAKMFLSTIVDTYYTYTDGMRSNPIPRISSLTGLPLIVDYDTAYAKVLRFLSSVETFAPTHPDEDPNLSILGKCRMLGESDPFFQILYTRLLRVDLNTETQLLLTIKSFNQNFQEINYKTSKEGTSFSLSDSINRRAIKNKPIQWSELFFNSRFVRHENNKTELNKVALKEMLSRFNILHKLVMDNKNSMTDGQFEEYLNTLILLFNELGINVDRSVFDLMLGGNNRKEAFVRRMDNRSAGSIYNFFNVQLDVIINNRSVKQSDGTVKPRQLNEVFVTNMNNIVNELAHYDVQAHPSENEISVLGPNNNIIFTKTLNNFVSDQIRWLNNHDELVMNDFKNDPYCHSSLIYNTVLAGGKVRLNTFVNFYGLDRKDKGRDYVSISPVEDYIAKMVFTWNNHLVFPTMADKKTWYTISGCKLFNEACTILPQGNGFKIEFDIDALDHVYNEWLDEYNTIVEYYNTLPGVTDFIKNYHTSGKGGLFRHHTGYYKNVKGELKWVDLNKRIQEAIKSGLKYDKAFGRSNRLAEFAAVRQVLEEIKQELFTGDRKATYQKINDNLSKERQAEIRKCIELGIIEMRNGRLFNKLLDASVLKHFKTLYEQSEHASVAALAEHFAIVTMVGNHMLNTNISIEETEKMFTGDPAFFKNNEDKIKRLGAVLSTGDNLRTQWMVSSTTSQESTEVTTERTRLQNRQTYTSTVINDNMIQSQQYDLLKQMFTQYYIRQLLVEQGLTEAQVDALSDEQIKKDYADVYSMAKSLAEDDASAYGLYKGKGAINQADAAVYISPAMYKDIVQMLGEWSDEIEEAFNIMESGLDWLSDKELCAKAMKALIKPLKTTYFCNQYNDNIKHTVPVFDKMAMFPLFRVIATGDNKELYDRMNAIGKYEGLQKIDQIAFESAKKVGIISPSDVYTDHTNELMNDLSNMFVVTQRFRNLRRQLITDPHTHDRTLFGTQVSTVAVSNLVLDRVYQEGTPNEKTGRKIMENLFGTINAISNHGIGEITEMYLTPNGEVDLEKTSMQLVKKAHSQNMGKDVEQALQLNETKDDFKIPLSALPDNKWVETALISDVNKKAVDLELPGGAFIQMSSFGVKQIRVVSSSGEYQVNNGKRLVNMNPDGSMDAVISINLLKHIIPGYDKMSFMEARQWLIDNHIIGENAEPAALGYRIPTQGLSSIAGIRISDVLPAVVGDTIILPDEFTAQTGSDFDIDKLYIARYNYGKVWKNADEDFESWYRGKSVLMAPDERGKQQYMNQYENRAAAREAFVEEKNREAGKKIYRIIGDVAAGTDVIEKSTIGVIPFDESLGYEGNSKEANENLLLRTYLDVLTDSKNVGETRLPLDKTTGIIKDEVLPIVDGPAKSEELIPYKELSPSYQMAKKYEYNGGKAGIGPFALNNKNHILTQLVGLRFKDDWLLKKLGFLGLHGINSRDENVIERDKKGRKLRNPDGSYRYKLEKGVRILDWLSAMINAHVDVAKDPYVIRLNVCQYTYNLCNFLLRVGYGKSTFFFLPQAIFKEMSAAYDNASGNYGVDATKSKSAVIRESIKNVRLKYADQFNEVAKRMGKDDIEVSVTDYGVAFTRKIVEKDETTGQEYTRQERMDWSDHATKLMGRDFLIDLLLISQILESDVQTRENWMTSHDAELYDYYLNQLRLSMLFEDLNSKAEDMSKLVQLSQIDTKRYGNNFVEQDRFIYRWKAFQVNTTLFDGDLVFDYFYNTFLYRKFINGVVTPQAIFTNMLLRSNRSFLDSITKVLMLTIGLEHNDEALNKTIANELEASIRNRFLTGKVNIKELFYGNNTMAKRLNQLKQDILSGKYPKYLTQDKRITNGLLNHLGVLSKQYTDAYDAPQIIIRKGIGENDKNLNILLKEYWSELLNDSEYPEIQKFALDLALYMLLTTGGNHTKNGIFSLIPIEYIINSGYADFIKSAIESFNSADIDYDAFFLNNWQNDKLVKEIKLTETVYDEIGQTTKDLFPIVRMQNAQGQRIPVVLNPRMTSRNQNRAKDPVFLPFIKVRNSYDNDPSQTLVYKFVGVNAANQTPVYVLVNKLGVNQGGRVVKEYHGSTTVSEFEFNNNSLAGVDIFGDILMYPMLEGDKKLLEQIINETYPVLDYLPVTQALSMQLVPNIRRNQTSKNRTEEQTVETNQPTSEQPSVQEEVVEEVVEHTFTFPNGFTVKTGFKLNDQQVEALNTLADFVDNPDKYAGKITLSGYAGTGKTTIMRFLHQYMQATGKGVIYSAPTHRANAVTQLNNRDATVLTLHSLFGIIPTIDITKETLDLKDLKNVLSEKGPSELVNPDNFLIIDESSMIDDTLYEFIQQAGEKLAGIIFVGDDAQLSPPQHEDGRISKVFTADQKVLQLTKVERTGDNPILKECTNLRNGEPFSYRTHLVNDEGVVYIGTLDESHNSEVLNVINTAVTSQESKEDPLFFRILCGTNSRVAEMNAVARQALFGNSELPVQVGEILMGYKNQKVGRDTAIHNSFDYIVTSASEEMSMTIQTPFGTVRYTGQYLTLSSIFDVDEKPINLKIVSNKNGMEVFDKLAEINKRFAEEVRRLYKNPNTHNAARRVYAEWMSFQNSIITLQDVREGNRVVLEKGLDFGYSHTIHKSQGGTYSKVMILDNSIENTQFEDLAKQQLRYVAMSRAKQNVWVVTQKPIGEEIKPEQKSKLTKTTKDVTRAQAMKNPRTLYIFTDNTNRTSGKTSIDPDSWYAKRYASTTPLRYPSQTSATLRGLDNSRPISTQRWYDPATGRTKNKGRWNNADFEAFKQVIDQEIQDIKEAWDSGKYDNVVIGTASGILRTAKNEGISGMTKERVPDLFDYLMFKMRELDAYVNGRPFNETYSKQTTPIEQSANVRTFNSVEEMRQAMFEDSDAFAGEVSSSPYKKVGSKFELKDDTPVKHYIKATAERGLTERSKEQFSEEDLEYLRDSDGKRDETTYFNVGYTSGDQDVIVVTNRELFDFGFTPKIIMYMRENESLDVKSISIDQFKKSSTFLVSSTDKKAIEFFEKNGYKYIVYTVQKSTPQSATSSTANPNVTPINVYSADRNGYESLSNFASRPFTMQQRNGGSASFTSVEQAFQFSKIQYFAKNPQVATQIMFSNNPFNIKRLGATTPMTAEQIASWNKVSTDLMYRLMKTSFMQNESAKQLLLSTGNAPLTHKNERGQEQDGGRFSKLLMRVRDEIRQSELHSDFFDGMSASDRLAIELQKKRQDEQCK